jgi:hypothetical protein
MPLVGRSEVHREKDAIMHALSGLVKQRFGKERVRDVVVEYRMNDMRFNYQVRFANGHVSTPRILEEVPDHLEELIAECSMIYDLEPLGGDTRKQGQAAR